MSYEVGACKRKRLPLGSLFLTTGGKVEIRTPDTAYTGFSSPRQTAQLVRNLLNINGTFLLENARIAPNFYLLQLALVPSRRGTGSGTVNFMRFSRMSETSL
jgi:hypothetical protein